MTVRVEFCGVPASGKSTLCAGALRELAKRGRSALSRAAMADAGLRNRDFGVIGNALGAVLPGWRRNFLGLPHGLNDWHRFVVDHPAFAALVHGWLAEGESDEAWRAPVFYSILTSAFEFQLANSAEHPVLMDEGFAQRFFSLRGYRGLGRPEDAVPYAASMPGPSALIWVSAPAALCAERAKKRDHVPLLLQKEPVDLLSVRFAEGDRLLAALAGELARRGVPVLQVDGAGDPEAEARRIADFYGALVVSDL